jgi:hypothetical protein
MKVVKFGASSFLEGLLQRLNMHHSRPADAYASQYITL